MFDLFTPKYDISGKPLCMDEEKTLSMPCIEFEKMNTRLQHKHTILKEALKLYQNHGKLTPINNQNFQGGPKGCSMEQWSILEAQREFMKDLLNLDSGIPVMDALKEAKLVKIDFDLPTKFYRFKPKRPFNNFIDVCNGELKKETFYYKHSMKYVKFDNNDGRWMECDSGGVCDLKTKSVSTPNSNMICVDFMCFKYDPVKGELFVNQESLNVMVNKQTNEQNNRYSFIRKLDYSETNCRNQKLAFQSGNYFYSSKFYSSFISLDDNISVGKAKIQIHTPEQKSKAKENNDKVDKHHKVKR